MIRLNLNDNVDGLVGVIGFRRRCRSSLTCSSCLTKIVLGWLVLPSGSREAAHQSPSQADSVSLAGSSGWSLMLIITVMLMMREEDDHLTFLWGNKSVREIDKFQLFFCIFVCSLF